MMKRPVPRDRPSWYAMRA